MLKSPDISITRKQLGYLLLIPSLVVICAVVLIPVLVIISYSFHTYKLNMPFLGKPFIGLSNYVKAFNDPRLWNAVKNTMHFVIGTTLGSLSIGFVVALILNREQKLGPALRTIVLLPWAIPTVVSGQTWKFMYNQVYGILNHLLMRIGVIGKPIAWLSTSDTAMNSVILADVWKGSPFVALMLLAGLKVIPRELYEAADVDGASTLRKLWDITIPLLKPTIIVTLLFHTLAAFKQFDLFFVLTYGGPLNATETLAMFGYKTLFPMLDFGYGSTIAVFMTIISATISVFYIKFLIARAAEER